jgi:L-alanine-DL-glutamate epimerase-like enolase superfamily enzyme
MNGAIKGNTFAKSAIETALLDAQGKALGLPVSALLGGALHDLAAGAVDAGERRYRERYRRRGKAAGRASPSGV